MPLAGALIAESLRIGSMMAGPPLTVRRISRADRGDVDAGQPPIWTFIEFEAADDAAGALAAALSEALEAEVGWYCDSTPTTRPSSSSPVGCSAIHAARSRGRTEAENYARSVGVPEPQLDWPE